MTERQGTQDWESASRARGEVRARLNDLGLGDLIGDAELVTAELVTNAMLHGGGFIGVSVVPADRGVRIEVADRSPIPPVLGRASDDAMTGRGLRLVASLSARWGTTPAGGGKIVWAEVTGEPSSDGQMLSEQELLAMWDDEIESFVAPDIRYHVELGEVPTELLLAAKSHVDNLVREFTLAAAGASAGITADLPPHLAALIERVVGQFAEARVSIKRQALMAANQGAQRTRLALDLPVEAASAGEEYLEALDEADAYCRATRLLTLETPPRHRIFRRWYVQELIGQLRSMAAGEQPEPPQPFEDRLLQEIDRVAEAERAADRATRLYALASALANAATPEAVADAVLTEGVSALEASGGGVLLATDADRLLVPGTIGYDEGVVQALRRESRDAELPAAASMRTGESVWIESRAERDRRFPELTALERTTVAVCAVPLIVQGRRLGALRFSFSEPRLFDEDERQFIRALAAQTAQVLDRAQLQQARLDASHRLQRSLLPPSLPNIPGVEIAAIYHPLADGMEVGVDFYDVFRSGDSHAFLIGDVAGTGPEAAAVTALVRYTLRALRMLHEPPADMLATLNEALLYAAEESQSSERFCTAIFGRLRTADGVDIDMASGGHLYPIVRRADGLLEEIELGGSLLGVLSEPQFSSATVRLSPGDCMVLFTDGVMEARDGQGRMLETEGVLEIVAGCTGSAADTARAVEEATLAYSGGQLQDDVAVLVIHAL